jgi:hypothetical protein
MAYAELRIEAMKKKKYAQKNEEQAGEDRASLLRLAAVAHEPMCPSREAIA